MKIPCRSCNSVFDVPDERLPKGKEIAFPCPNCKAMIELDLTANRISEDGEKQDIDKAYTTGDELKKKILRSVNDLPPMPQTVLRAREIMQDPKSDFKELGRLLETDQAIVAKVLKLANSPYYGMAGKIASAQHASVVLGHKALAELITMGGTAGLLGKTLEGYGLDSGDLWRHSLGVAFGSKIIANRKKPALANDGFTAGLIHDAGKLILNPYIIERWELFEDIMNDGSKSFLDAEREALGFDHAEIASEVCKKWNIPQVLATAVRYHHHPCRSNAGELACIVHVADVVSMMANLAPGVDGMAYEVDGEAMDVLVLQEDDISGIMCEILSAVEKISE